MNTMLKLITLLTCICWYGAGSPLHSGPDPLTDGAVSSSSNVAKSRSPRQIAFLPFVAIPPVYHVHQIVLVQPNQQCPSPVPTPGPGVGPAAGPGDDGLGFKLGNENDTDTSATPQEPSRCVWSIVACCAPGSRNIRYTCFELLGCPGAFWDVNPCDEKVVMAAANTALKFYEQNSTDSRRRK